MLLAVSSVAGAPCNTADKSVQMISLMRDVLSHVTTSLLNSPWTFAGVLVSK